MLKIKAETILDMQEEEKHFLEQLTALDNAYVEIGILAKDGSTKKKSHNENEKSPLTLVEVATIMEYGSEIRNIPARSFIGSTMDENNENFNQSTNKLIDKIIDRALDTDKALKLLGLMIETAIKNKITSNIAPELKPATIRAKGSSVALIDTKQLFNSIKSAVQKEGAKGKSMGTVSNEKDEIE